jgi:acylphosphatase
MWSKAKPVMEGVYLYISGRVQGVGYRAAMKAEAEKMGVSGWCQNMKDGSVSSILIGETLAVRHLLRWCKHGPVKAFVQEVEDTYLGSDDDLYKRTLHLVKNKFLILEDE